MSHVVTIQTEVRDAVALGAACRRLKLSQPARQATKLFSGEVTGLAVRLTAGCLVARMLPRASHRPYGHGPREVFQTWPTILSASTFLSAYPARF